MLSQSMLQKFTNKIQKLVSQPSQQSDNQEQSGVQQVSNIGFGQERLRKSRASLKRNELQDSLDSQQQVKNGQENGQNVESSAEPLQQQQSVSKAKNQKRNPRQPWRMANELKKKNPEIDMKSERIHPKQLSRLIQIQKQKSRMAKLSAQSNQEKKIIQQLHKNGNISMHSQNRFNQNQAIKQNIQMPKLATMNNLVKLSTKLPLIDFLQLIKYEATALSMTPIRLLLYWCIQRIFYHIYLIHGIEKMNLRQRDIQFLENEIKSSLVSLIGYAKITQRTMISRVLRGVFNRTGYPHVYSQQWLTNCLKQKKSSFQAMKLPIEQLLKPPTSNNISSKIFNGIPLAEVKPKFNFPDLDLEDESEDSERIQDPEIFHAEQKMFFFLKSKINGEKFNKTKTKNKDKKGESWPEKQVFSDDDANFEQSQFQIQIQKLQVPSNSKVYSSPETNDFELGRKKKIKIGKTKKPDQISFDEEQADPAKRKNYIFSRQLTEESKESKNYLKQYTEELLTKDKISQLIEQYLNDNLQQLANRIASKLTINYKKTNQPKRTKMKSTSLIFAKQKEKSDSEIIKEMDDRSQQLQKIGINYKDLVKQMLKLLQSKSLANDRKQQLMDKWILLKQRNK